MSMAMILFRDAAERDDVQVLLNLAVLATNGRKREMERKPDVERAGELLHRAIEWRRHVKSMIAMDDLLLLLCKARKDNAIDDDCNKSHDALQQRESSKKEGQATGGTGPSSVSGDCVTMMTTTQRNGGDHRSVGPKRCHNGTFMCNSSVGGNGDSRQPRRVLGRDASAGCSAVCVGLASVGPT